MKGSSVILRLGLPCAIVLLNPVRAMAQWTYVNLHPAGATWSLGYGTNGTIQVGVGSFGGGMVALKWNGAAASAINMNPASASESGSDCASGTKQVGWAKINGWQHASLWSSTAASWVDLNPPGYDGSQAFGIDGNQQVGYVIVNGALHASRWTSTASSWVDLNPSGSTESGADRISGSKVVGWARVGGIQRASLWSGTAASWVDLNPSGAGYSQAFGVDGGQQVGYAYIFGAKHAGLWNGSSGSWVDLHPASASESLAMSVNSGQQVGEVMVGGQLRATLWSGTPASMVNLHAFLPSYYTASRARSIAKDGGFIYVVGDAYNSQTGRSEAMMWKSPVIQPTVSIVSAGMVKWNTMRVTAQAYWPAQIGSLKVKFTVNGVIVERTQAIPGSGVHNIDFKLDQYGVPRFSNPQTFSVTVTPMINGVAAGYAATRSVFIPIPVLIIQGLFTDVTNPKLEPLIKQFELNGYRRDGPTEYDYPTVKLIDETVENNYGYFPSLDTLAVNAGQIRNAIVDFTSSTSNKTYATRVDIVSHSKGGLVSRMYLKMYDQSGSTVRKLLMACSPHTGSLKATYFDIPVNHELSPVNNWQRATSLGSFAIPTYWYNATLIDLNSWRMPASITYYIMYGYSYNTWINETLLPIYIRSADGDGVVTQLSQRGYNIINNQNGSVTSGSKITAFDSLNIRYSAFQGLGHSGFLDNARESVVANIMN